MSEASFTPTTPSAVRAAMCGRTFGSYSDLLLLIPAEAGAGKANELDAELLDCCDAARAADRQAALAVDGFDMLDLDEPAGLIALHSARPLVDAYFDAIDRATVLPARTPEGLRAKATLLLLHSQADDDVAALAVSLARDVAGRT